jgi:hypothetical protein
VLACLRAPAFLRDPACLLACVHVLFSAVHFEQMRTVQTNINLRFHGLRTHTKKNNRSLFQGLTFCSCFVSLSCRMTTVGYGDISASRQSAGEMATAMMSMLLGTTM